jgi:integrase
MKGRQEHVVPLSSATQRLLEDVRKMHRGSQLVFPGTKHQPLSDMTFTKIVRDLGFGDRVTPHGFRATFKTWSAEVSCVRDEVSEAALAHQIPEKVRAAYLRSDFLEERTRLMDCWSAYVAQPAYPPSEGAPDNSLPCVGRIAATPLP